MSQLEINIVSKLSKPAWMPDIAKETGASLIKTRNAVARLFDQGVIDITKKGFVAAPLK